MTAHPRPRTDRGLLTASVNRARTNAQMTMALMPVLVTGVPLTPAQYRDALSRAEELSQHVLRYTRYLSALAAIDGERDT